MALFIKKNTDYLSPLDRCLKAWRKTAQTTVSQQREITHCEKIHKKMMQAKTSQNQDDIWEDF